MGHIVRLVLFFICGHLLADDAAPSRDQIEKDLALQMVLKSPTSVKVGGEVHVDLVLRNRSLDHSHPVIAPGGGSELGWREPYVYFSAELDEGDGHAKPVPK